MMNFSLKNDEFCRVKRDETRVLEVGLTVECCQLRAFAIQQAEEHIHLPVLDVITK